MSCWCAFCLSSVQSCLRVNFCYTTNFQNWRFITNFDDIKRNGSLVYKVVLSSVVFCVALGAALYTASDQLPRESQVLKPALSVSDLVVFDKPLLIYCTNETADSEEQKKSLLKKAF